MTSVDLTQSGLAPTLPPTANRHLRRVLDGGRSRMAEHLNRFARQHGIVPVEMFRRAGVEGWLFRDRQNQLVFVSKSELESSAPVKRE